MTQNLSDKRAAKKDSKATAEPTQSKVKNSTVARSRPPLAALTTTELQNDKKRLCTVVNEKENQNLSAGPASVDAVVIEKPAIQSEKTVNLKSQETKVVESAKEPSIVLKTTEADSLDF